MDSPKVIVYVFKDKSKSNDRDLLQQLDDIFSEHGKEVRYILDLNELSMINSEFIGKLIGVRKLNLEILVCCEKGKHARESLDIIKFYQFLPIFNTVIDATKYFMGDTLDE